MSSLQSLRELISERLAAAAEEICRLCEGTIVQYEQELCRQRRLLDVIWKPQLQLHHIVLPQHWMTEEDDLCDQQRNFRVEQEEPEPLQIKEEPGELFINQDEDQFDLKQETDTLMEIPTYEEDENSEAVLNNQQSFNVTDSQDEEGNQHEESTSTTDEETDPQNRDQKKRRDRSHVQSVDSSHMSAERSGGRRENPIWQAKLFLLPGPDNGFLPPTTVLEELAKHGLGKPVHELMEAGRTNSKIGLNWSLSELNNFVCQSYPRISLNLVGFELARTSKGRKIEKLQVSSVKELKAVVGKSRLYIVPRTTVLQVTSPPSAMTLKSFAPLAAPAVDETSQVVSDQERKKLVYQACEERRQKAIEARRQRMSACEEPSDGVLIKFKYPNGHTNMRKFRLSEPIQILFDFVGQDDIASEIFVVQEAASSRSVGSSSSGSIMDHGIKASSTLYVLWFSNKDVQEILSDQQSEAYALHQGSATFFTQRAIWDRP
ncbi:uncharacterized protein LOC144987221 isoform X4 [Oryzias latipes]